MGIKKLPCIYLKHRADDGEFVMQMLAENDELKRQRDKAMNKIKQQEQRQCVSAMIQLLTI